MRSLTFISFLLTVLLISCGSNENSSKKHKTIASQKSDFNWVSVETIDDEGFLEDSVAFYNFVCEIISNKEVFSEKEFIPGSGTIIDRIYEFVYQTPDSIIPLTRKMDLLQMLSFYYRGGSDYYLQIVHSKLEQNKDGIASRPFLLFPFTDSKRFSQELMECLLKSDKIEVSSEYVKYASQVVKYLNTLPRENFKESFKKLHSDRYVENPNNRTFFSKRFQDKYNDLGCWTISPY